MITSHPVAILVELAAPAVKAVSVENVARVVRQVEEAIVRETLVNDPKIVQPQVYVDPDMAPPVGYFRLESIQQEGDVILRTVYWVPNKVTAVWTVGVSEIPAGIKTPRFLNMTMMGVGNETTVSSGHIAEWEPEEYLYVAGDTDGPVETSIQNGSLKIRQKYKIMASVRSIKNDSTRVR